jgi:superfamily I DNA/RNA helicase
VLDRTDSADLMDVVRNDLGLARTRSRFPQKAICLAIYSYTVNAGCPLAETLADFYPWSDEWEAELKRLFAGYVTAKQRDDVLDYDDLLLYWREATRIPAIAAQMRAEFDHILVDEYQDTNQLQADILLALAPDGVGLTVVGDDAQSIYAFRAATVRNILDFPGQFSPPAMVITLEHNYRSTQPILDAANAVMARASEGFAKMLTSSKSSAEPPYLVTVEDEAAQAVFIADQVLEQREAGIELRHQAILFRASHHSARLEIELARRNIPFVKYGGLKFIEARMSRTFLRSCAGQKTRVTRSPRSVHCSCCRASVPPLPRKRQHISPRTASMWPSLPASRRPPRQPCPGQNSAAYCEICTMARSPGQGRSVLSGYGISRISNGSTITRRHASAISNSWSRSRSAIPAVNAFWPN